MKKKVLAILLCSVMVLSMGSCSGGSNSDSKTGSESPTETSSGATTTAAAAKDVTIRFTWWGDTARHEVYNAVCDEFEKANPGVTVEREANSWADYWEKLAVQVAGGTAPDVIGMHSQFVADYSTKNALLDLQPYIDDGTIDTTDIDDVIVETGRVGGKICMIAQGITTASLIANKTMLDKYGIEYPAYNEDWTWDEFAAAGEKFEAATDGALWFSNDWSSGSINNLRYWARIKGQEAYTEDGELGFTNDTVTEWLTMWKNLRDKNIVPDAATSNEDGTLALEQKIFTTGKCAMHNVPANQLWLYQKQMPDSEIILIRQPIGNNNEQGAIIEGAHNAVYAKSANPDVAAKFISFFVNDSKAVNLLKMEQGVPVNTKRAAEIAPTLGGPQALAIQFVNSYLDVATGFTYPPAGASEIDTAWKNCGQSVGFGESTPEDASTAFCTEAAAIIAKNK